ncbi:undecaprenyl-diphosphatase [Elusimicrobium simillimum]|uniref:undecaprenyl-diphosphate phosphatase n=1 Tax=Elusimicrobium simillimum TaxID=3143438 RepID=UPI003C6F47E3
MTITSAILLGIVQAAGEFLPISSSAHLVLMPWLMGNAYQGVTYDIALHAATLFAVLFYFRKEWFHIIKDGLTKPATAEGKTLWLLVLATVPAAIAGLLLEDIIETTFRSPFLIAIALIVFALILAYADRKGGAKGNILTVKTALIIGLAQTLALMPGVSRSGITITAALLLGFTRKESAKISFLLSVPVIAGAAVLKLKDINIADINTAFICGFITALIGGWLVIKFLMTYIQKHNFNIFVVYRIVLGVVIIATYLIKN